VLALAGPVPGKQRCSDCLRGSQSGGVVGNDRSDHPRPTSIAVSLDVRETRQGLNNRIVCALTRVRTSLAEPAYRDVDDVLAYRADGIFAQANALGGTRPKIVDQKHRRSRSPCKLSRGHPRS
jgi:hypothetical protein